MAKRFNRTAQSLARTCAALLRRGAATINSLAFKRDPLFHARKSANECRTLIVRILAIKNRTTARRAIMCSTDPSCEFPDIPICRSIFSPSFFLPSVERRCPCHIACGAVQESQRYIFNHDQRAAQLCAREGQWLYAHSYLCSDFALL